MKIVGYSTTVMGLKSNCKLKSVLPLLSSPFYSIEVVPALPRLQIQVMSPTRLAFSNSRPQIYIYII